MDCISLSVAIRASPSEHRSNEKCAVQLQLDAEVVAENGWNLARSVVKKECFEECKQGFYYSLSAVM